MGIRIEPVGSLADVFLDVIKLVAAVFEIVDQLPKLKMIAVTATGYNVIDTAACAERDIVVSNVSGYAVDTVPEHTFALILALRRSLIGYRRDVAAGEWVRSDQFCLLTHPIQNLFGSGEDL